MYRMVLSSSSTPQPRTDKRHQNQPALATTGLDNPGVGDDDLPLGRAGSRSVALDLLHDVQALDNLT